MFGVTQYTGFAATAQNIVAPTPPAGVTLVGWYDFSDTSKLTTSGADISAITDKSGNAYNGTSTNSGTNTKANPSYTANVLNNLGAAKFQGGGTNTATKQYMGVSTNILGTSSSTFSVTCVAKPIGTGTVGYVFALNAGGGARHYIARGVSPNVTVVVYGNLLASVAVSTTGNIHALSARAGGDGTASATYRIDGAVSTGSITGGALATQTCTGLFIGNDTIGSPWDGYVGEVRVFAGYLNQTALQKEEGYLAWKWGLVGSLPAGHPYKSFPP